MKKVLLGTTALLAAGMFSGEAFAQARTPMTSTNLNLSLGGFTTFRFEWQSKNPSQNLAVLDADGTLADEPRKYNFDFDGEIEFKGNATLSNGVKMGFEIELETAGAELRNGAGKLANGFDRTASCTGTAGAGPATANGVSGGSTCGQNRLDFIDDNFMYVQGRLGKITMGGLRDERLEVGVPRGFTDVGAVAIDTTDDPVAGNNEISNFNNTIDLNNGVNKIIYEPPAMFGFRIALNWSPDVSMENSTQQTQKDDAFSATSATAAQQQDDIHLATQWAGSLMGNRVRVSAGYATAKSEDSNANAEARGAVGAGLADVQRNNRWRLGADIQLLGFTIGGVYHVRHDNAVSWVRDEKRTGWGLGFTYDLGVWTFGAAWEQVSQDELNQDGTSAGGTGKDKARRWDAGIDYTGLGGGKTIRIGYRNDRFKDNLSDPDDEAKIRNMGVRFEWDVGPGLEFDVGYQNYNYSHHAGVAADTAPQRTTHAVFMQTKITF